MLLIMSAAFVGAELEAEFGRVPPSFLPLGNKRLFQRQLALREYNEHAVITLPRSYVIGEADKHFLEKQNVEILRLAEGITLGQSFTQALLMIDLDGLEKVKVLFGDTLINGYPDTSDGLGTALIKDDYGWAKVVDFFPDAPEYNSDGSLSIFAGSLVFTRKDFLLKCLATHNFKFVDGLKAYYEYVDGIAYSTEEWLDFGHVNTFYASRADFTTQREFNELVITPTHIIKTSDQKEKILAEANWFKSIPDELKIFIPQFIGEIQNNQKNGYKLEYLYNLPLNELFVFSILSDKTWETILGSCLNFVSRCRDFSMNHQFDLSDLLEKKTTKRLSSFFKSNGLSQNDKWCFHSKEEISINQILIDVSKFLPKSDLCTVMHGDFCFSNIIYDFKSSRVKVIDPRGINNDKTTIYGSAFYDLAKISHSVFGLYDFIISENYELKIETNQISFSFYVCEEREALQDWFMAKVENDFKLKVTENLAMQIHLFLSMLPLHSDDPRRQNAIFANVFRIYYKIQECCSHYGLQIKKEAF